MAIEKESSGFPEVDPTRPTTKVNLAMIVAVAIFYVITFGLLFYFAGRENEPETDYPSPPILNQ